MATVATENINEHVLQSWAARPEGMGRESNRAVSPMSRRASYSEKNKEKLPRAASYTYLPKEKGQHFRSPAVGDAEVHPGISCAANQPEYAHETSPCDTSPTDKSGLTTPDDHGPATVPPSARDITVQLRKSLSKSRRDITDQSTRSSIESSVRQSGTSQESNRTVSTTATTCASSQRRHSINKSVSKRLSRESRAPSTTSTPSRSPSPQKHDAATVVTPNAADLEHTQEASTARRRKSLISRKLTMKTSKDGERKKDSRQSGEEQESDKSPTGKGTFIRRMNTGRVVPNLSKIVTNGTKSTSMKHTAPAVPSMPKSFSTDRLPTVTSITSLSDRITAVPKLLSPSMIHSDSPLSTSKKKDELWGIFRTLDADYAKFSSKTSALKANVVRSCLIPFLRTYASHPSNRNLRLEDLDRRTNILNRWWTGLVEMLHGRNNQSISGTDRPVILDGVLGIMERTEWRLDPSPFCPLHERAGVNPIRATCSNTSLASSSSDFLADSIHHNVRNIFVQNLSSQMAFVVDKMSLRNASASLVNFCGKACAYAFMFVPGMADVLVRLWELPVTTIRRVLRENGIGKFDKMPMSACDLVSDFPPALRQLEFSSLAKYMRKLRTPPPLPPGTTHIQWWGHWLERWSGRESDLFYVFVKQFHILVADFLPRNTTRTDRLAAPGMLLVHAQILNNLDATIHRDTSQVQQDPALTTPSATFDEVLGDPDVIASALPVPPINATRLMAENRLIMLIRDFLSEKMAQHRAVRDIFARSFNDLLQAAAKGVSMFDQSACYTLLDFLEEALIILVRYEQLLEADASFVDYDFWWAVCRKMIDSENTMTEVRLYAFLYTIWNIIIGDSGRKRNLCMDLLLEQDIFESRFNHWCPMVRAYYMRLLCWRLARYNDENDDGDVLLLETLQERLLNSWSYYLYLRDIAESQKTLRPATNPCHPAPGRRLIVVRTDNQVNNAAFLTFDGVVRESPSQMARTSWNLSASTYAGDFSDSRPGSSSSNMDSGSESHDNGIGGFLRKMIGGKSRSRSRSREAAERVVSGALPDLSGRAPALSKAIGDAGAEVSRHDVQPTQRPQHRSLSFKFSLEAHTNAKQLPPMRLLPPRLPPPAQTYLERKSQKSSSAPNSMPPVQPVGKSVARARYSGRALAEWTMVVGECHSFFERRKNEGVPSNRHVETPTLGVEVFRRPS